LTKKQMTMSEPDEPYIHAAYFNDRDAAERCRAELADLAYRVTPIEATEEGDPSGAWKLRAGRVMDPEEYESQSERVGAIVADFGGYYDGGYWSIEPNGPAGWDDIEPPTVFP
jgi:hypothetical protein